MKKFLIASLSTLWLFVIPKDPMSLVLIYPASTLALAQYCRLHTQLGLQLIVFALLWDISLSFWLMVRAISVPQKALIKLLTRLKDCGYMQIDLDAVMSNDQSVFLNKASLAQFLGGWGLPYKASDYAQVYRVIMGQTGILPNSLGAFNIPFLRSVILVRDEPVNSETPERFFFWHEIGHTLGNEFAEQSSSQKGATSPLFAITLGGFVLNHNVNAISALACCLVAWGMAHFLLKNRKQMLKIENEANADGFALQFLNEAERRFVAENFEWIVPADGELSSREHRLRLANLQTLIRTGESIVKDQIRIDSIAWFRDIVLTGVNLGAWMIVLSQYLSNPTSQNNKYFLWAVIGIATLAVLNYIKFYVMGFVEYFILSGRIRWVEGRFQWGRVPATAPDEAT
jgi:hypothetical protein